MGAPPVGGRSDRETFETGFSPWGAAKAPRVRSNRQRDWISALLNHQSTITNAMSVASIILGPMLYLGGCVEGIFKRPHCHVEVLCLHYTRYT